MKKSTLMGILSASLALIPLSNAIAQAPNPTPNRQSTLITGFESGVEGVVNDPLGTGTNNATLNTDAQFVSEGTKSLSIDLTEVSEWLPEYFVIDLSEPIDISGAGALTMDVYIPVESMDDGNPDGGWWQFTPHIVTTNPDDETMTTESWLGMRNMGQGWNHLTFDLQNNTDTKVTRLLFAGNINSEKPYTGPIYVDNIRVWEGVLPGIHADEKLIYGFDDPALNDNETLTTTEGIVAEVISDEEFVRDGEGALQVDLTGVPSGWQAGIVRIDDFGAPTIDATNASAIHLDVFVPEESRDLEWSELGFIVIGEGGEVWGSSSGYITNQWNTLQIVLNDDQRAMLSNIRGISLIKNNGSEWNGPVYIDNLRAVVPTEVPSVMFGDLNGDERVNVQDATLSLRIAVGSLTPTAEQTAAADVNGDGRLNVQDTTLILRKSVGSLAKFPVEP